MNSTVINRDDVPRTRRARLQEIFRDESNGGITVITAAIIAIAWANSPWSHTYEKFVSSEIGTASFSLSLSHWVSELLLAAFFFVVGIELKYEISFGSLSSVRKALVPTSAAVGGMSVAGLIYYALNAGTQFESAWAIPISTDIAFALALLAVVGKALPQQLRIFLLTVAVVNDLLAISVIAFFYGGTINWLYLGISALLILIFGLVQRTAVTSLAIYVPLAACAWYAMYQSGIHATVTGVALGLVMRNRTLSNESSSPAAHAEHVLRPFTAGFCVPMFALVTAGISFMGVDWASLLGNTLTFGVLLGLVVGQPLGVLLATKLATSISRTSLPVGLSWMDIWVIGSMASIGFTVALLVSAVSFTEMPQDFTTAKFAIVLTNIVAMVVATITIQVRAKILGNSTS